MAQSTASDHVSDLDRHVKVLEERVAKLQTSLAHWQEWYLEYAALKEEVGNLLPQGDDNDENNNNNDDGDEGKEPAAARRELARLRRDFQSDLLTQKEINEIFGKNDLRAPAQVVALLERRIDYVERNVEALRKALDAEENKLAAATVVSNPDGGVDEDTGLPITDIVEELDEDDNVVGFRLQTGGDAQPQIAEALKRAGLEEFQDASSSNATAGGGETSQKTLPTSTASPPKPATTSLAPGTKSKPTSSSISRPKPEPESSAESIQNTARENTRKSVLFAEDTKPGDESVDAPEPESWAARQLGQIMQTAREQESMDMSSAVMPENEAAEDRELRHQMLEYSMSEIGPVVAELELEDISDEDSIVFSDTDEEGSDEDELGRSSQSVITDDYVQRMKDLEKRLKKTSAFAADPPRQKTDVPEEGVGRISVMRPPDVSDLGSANGAKKAVRFAPSLDIADDDSKSAPAPAPTRQPRPRVETVKDIVERAAGGADEPPAEEPPKRVSRFKKERAGSRHPAPPSTSIPKGPHQVPASIFGEDQSTTPYTVPSGPEGQTLAQTVVEREVSSEAREPGDLDDALVYQEAAAEYHRLRNRLMQKQGGFVKQDESPVVPLDEEEGGPKRVSRFKAARLSR